jgi:hypothetical protein
MRILCQLAHKIAGAAGLPCTLLISGAGNFRQNLVAARRENAKSHLPSLRAKRSNPSRLEKERMDCFASLAMTIPFLEIRIGKYATAP